MHYNRMTIKIELNILLLKYFPSIADSAKLSVIFPHTYSELTKFMQKFRFYVICLAFMALTQFFFVTGSTSRQ